MMASDLHYRLPHYDWLVNATERVDVMALVGDLADVVNRVPFDVQVVVLKRYLLALANRTTVLAASGNHDLDGPGEQGEQVARWLRDLSHEKLSCDGSSRDLGGVRFTVCPWWDGPLTRDAVAAQLEAAAIDRPATWIWVYHAPPAHTVLCNDGRREFPDYDLAAWIEQYQPDFVLCGHIHQAPWAEGGSWHARIGRTWVFNAGKQLGPIPPHVTIDTSLQTAEWYGVFSSETISLS